MKIGELLKCWRHHHHMSIEEAAKTVGVSWDVYRRVELGSAMKPDTFQRIMVWMLSE